MKIIKDHSNYNEQIDIHEYCYIKLHHIQSMTNHVRKFCHNSQFYVFHDKLNVRR